jgi:hypothetical protein
MRSFRLLLASTTVLVAVAAGPSATAATYNFYFPKNEDSPRVERRDADAPESELSAESETGDEDEESSLETVATAEVPSERDRATQAQLQIATPGVSCGCPHGAIPGAIVLPPGSKITITGDVEVVRGDDVFSGTNTTAGLRLRPRTKVVRRTIVFEP